MSPELEHSGASRLFALKQPRAPGTSLSELRLRCQLAPHPTFPPAGFSDDTVSLGLKLSVASLAREGLSPTSLPRTGRLRLQKAGEGEGLLQRARLRFRAPPPNSPPPHHLWAKRGTSPGKGGWGDL